MANKVDFADVRPVENPGDPAAPLKSTGPKATLKASDTTTIEAPKPSAVTKSGERQSINQYMAQSDRWKDATKGDVATETAKNVGIAGLTIAAAILSGPFAPLVLLGGLVLGAGRAAAAEKNHRNQHFQGLDQDKLNNTVHWIAKQGPMLSDDKTTARTLTNLATRYSIAKKNNNVDEQLEILGKLEDLANSGAISHHIDFSKLQNDTDHSFDAHDAGVVAQKPYEERIKLLCAGQHSPPNPMNASGALSYYNKTLEGVTEQGHKALVALPDPDFKAHATYQNLLKAESPESTTALLAIDKARKARVMLVNQHTILSGKNNETLAGLEKLTGPQLLNKKTELNTLGEQLRLQGEIETALTGTATIHAEMSKRYENIRTKAVAAIVAANEQRKRTDNSAQPSLVDENDADRLRQVQQENKLAEKARTAAVVEKALNTKVDHNVASIRDQLATLRANNAAAVQALKLAPDNNDRHQLAENLKTSLREERRLLSEPTNPNTPTDTADMKTQIAEEMGFLEEITLTV